MEFTQDANLPKTFCPVLFSSKSNEHYTPIDLLERVYDFFGDKPDLDPASDGKHTRSYFHYTEEDNGLSQEWFGNVFLNPPYGREIPKWVDAVLDKQEEYDQLLFLVPSRTDTKWYAKLSHLPRLNFRGRLKFLNPNNKGNPAPFPSVMFYAGDNITRFRDVFGSQGEIILPWNTSEKYLQAYMDYRRRHLM